MASSLAELSMHVRCVGVAKSFGTVRALRRADLDVREGRISALVGENGAGKSTLMQLISGDLRPDGGTIEIGARVGLVRQQLATIGELSVLENIVFGAERSVRPTSRVLRALGGIDWPAHRRRVEALMDRTGLRVPVRAEAADLPVGVRQRVDILSALYQGAKCLLLDEPTTYLTPSEVDGLFEVMRGLVAEGMSVVFISHRLREVAQHCDDVTVLRKGETTMHLPRAPFDLGEIGRAMSGGTVSAEPVRSRPPASSAGEVRLAVMSGALRIRAGEIVGIAGVSGNGQNELLDAIAGIGEQSRVAPVILDGTDRSHRTAMERRQAGLRFIPESVKESGSAMDASITDNVMTANPPRRLVRHGGLIDRRAADAMARGLIDRARIVADGPHQLAGQLSGGNLQRVAVARELGEGAAVLLAHEPTRGVDFGGVALIHDQLREFAAAGGAVLLLSSDIDELLALSDRIHIIDRSRLGPAHPREELSVGRLGELLGGLDATDSGEAPS
jgi:simple sugar transport system ATP-binding protein